MSTRSGGVVPPIGILRIDKTGLRVGGGGPLEGNSTRTGVLRASVVAAWDDTMWGGAALDVAAASEV